MSIRLDDDNAVLQASQQILIIGLHRLVRGTEFLATSPEPFQLRCAGFLSFFRPPWHTATSSVKPCELISGVTTHRPCRSIRQTPCHGDRRIGIGIDTSTGLYGLKASAYAHCSVTS